jgi:hypothetical protein
MSRLVTFFTFMIGGTERFGRYGIGKRTVSVLILMSILYGCSWITGTEYYAPYSWPERKEKILTWAASEKTKVDRGTLANSKYWEEFYQKSIELRPDLDDFLYFSAEMIKVSRIFEEGKVTKKQFEEKSRDLAALFDREEKRRRKLMCSSVSRFTCYRGSLFVEYVNDLRTHLNAAGPQFSASNCAFFGDSIQCANTSHAFLY